VTRAARGNYQQRNAATKGPRTFVTAPHLAPYAPQFETLPEMPHYPAAGYPPRAEYPSPNTAVSMPPVVLPSTFLCAPTTHEQQETMTQAILIMDEASQALTAVSIVEEALQKSSGMRATTSGEIAHTRTTGAPGRTSNRT
jgi:hypothetical protein